MEKILKDHLTIIARGISEEILMQSMEDVLKNFQKNSIEGFPNGIPEGFSNGVDGPILEETQGMFYKKKSSYINFYDQ